MYGRKVKLRFFFILLILLTLILSVFLILKSLEENVVYFQSPTEIKTFSEIDKKKIRIGGMVKVGSISMEVKEIILLSKIFEFLKFLIENKIIKKEKQKPKTRE